MKIKDKIKIGLGKQNIYITNKQEIYKITNRIRRQREGEIRKP